MIASTFKKVVHLAGLLGAASLSAACGSSVICDSSVAQGKPGACANNNLPAGSIHGPCRTSGAKCDSGGRCYADTCLPCGGANEICCKNGNAECNGGTCADPPSSSGQFDVDICRVDCGGTGQGCCDVLNGNTSVCQGGTKCYYDMCPGTPAEPSCGGSAAYSVAISGVQSDCIVNVVHVLADSESQAEACANPDPGFEADAFPTASFQNDYQKYSFCDKVPTPLPGNNLEIWHYDKDAAKACMVEMHCAATGPDQCHLDFCA